MTSGVRKHESRYTHDSISSSHCVYWLESCRWPRRPQSEAFLQTNILLPFTMETILSTGKGGAFQRSVIDRSKPENGPVSCPPLTNAILPYRFSRCFLVLILPEFVFVSWWYTFTDKKKLDGWSYLLSFLYIRWFNCTDKWHTVPCSTMSWIKCVDVWPVTFICLLDVIEDVISLEVFID